jgi:choline dehydrogenase-like flavoprotein
MFVQEALGKGATLVNRAKVTRVLVEKKKAVGVEYVMKKEARQVRAPSVVVAAGGIGSTAILRESGIENAGHDFFIDPLVSVMGKVDDIKGGREFPMATGMQFEDDGYIMTDLTVPPAVYFTLSGRAGWFDRIFSHSRTLTVMIKVKDELGGSLTQDGQIKKQMTEKDRQAMSKGVERAKDILRKTGASDVFLTPVTAAHPGGTAKIGDVVDENLETSIENLYVCDCSVIPEAWGRPPVLTLLGLGKRLGKHLC